MITAPLEPEAGRIGSLVERVGAAARAGVHLIQIRQPHLDGRALMSLVTQATAAVEGTRARIIVNDRTDVALETRAHGVHLRGDSVPASRVRSVAPRPLLIGRSVHAPDEAMRVARDGGLEYLIFGSVYPPRSKPSSRVAGPDMLGTVCRNVALPVLAVGGMTLDRLSPVARTGAAGFAAIGMFAETPLDALGALVQAAWQLFDTSKPVP
jgi:thiamine-phosphate pyrophosphorylase